MQALSLVHVQKLLLDIKSARLYAACVVVFMVGLRRGALLALRWQDVDLTTGSCISSRLW